MASNLAQVLQLIPCVEFIEKVLDFAPVRGSHDIYEP